MLGEEDSLVVVLLANSNNSKVESESYKGVKVGSVNKSGNKRLVRGRLGLLISAKIVKYNSNSKGKGIL